MYAAPMIQFPRPGRMLRILLIINVVAFVIELVGIGIMGRIPFFSAFALSRSGLGRGMLWQIITYSLLHDGLGHLFFNMIGLYFFGCETERALGSQLFLRLYVFCAVVAGLGWLLVSGGPGIPLVGASGAVLGIVGMYAALYPRRRITLLLFLVMPVTMTARTLALGYMVLSFVMMLDSGSGVAHAAHLFGGVAGYGLGLLTVRSGDRRRGTSGQGRAARRRRRFTVIEGEAINHDEEPVVSRAEVDRILEKIKRDGIRSLTRSERRMLDNASQGFDA